MSVAEKLSVQREPERPTLTGVTSGRRGRLFGVSYLRYTGGAFMESGPSPKRRSNARWRRAGPPSTRGARSLQDAYRAAVHARNSGAFRAGDRCAETDAPQNQILQVDSLDLGGPRTRRALRSMGPRHAYRSAWAGGSAVLVRCCERVVVATETPQFVVLVVDVRGRAGFATPAPHTRVTNPRPRS